MPRKRKEESEKQVPSAVLVEGGLKQEESETQGSETVAEQAEVVGGTDSQPAPPVLVEETQPKKRGRKPKKQAVDSPTVIDLSNLPAPPTRAEIEALAKSIGAVRDPEQLLAPVKWSLPSGCTPLNAILGGGWHSGRMHEIIGEYSSGKSSLLEHAIASCQKHQGIPLLINSEAAVDLKRMQRIGCDTEAIIWEETDSLKEGFGKIKQFLEETPPNRVLLIAWDTIAACHSDDTRPGSAAREVHEALRWLPLLLSRKQAVLLFANQISTEFTPYSPEPANPHGLAIRFHASTRIHLKSKRKLGPDGRLLAEESTTSGQGIFPIAQCIKNKTFPPFRRCRIPIMFDNGVDDDMALWHYFEGSSWFEKSGGWVRIKDERFQEPFQLCTWKEKLNTPGLREWLWEKAYELAYLGYDPTK